MQDLLQLDHEPLKTALRTQQKPTIWVAQRDAAIWVRILPRVGIGPPACLRADEQICLRCLKSSPQRLCPALNDDVCVGEQPRLAPARLEVRVPGEVIASGVLPTGRGVEADRDGRKAILLLPTRAVTDDGDDFVWDITWRK